MEKSRLVRFLLFLASTGIVAVALTFLWFLNLNQAPQLRQIFTFYLVLLSLFSALSLGIFFARGAIFDVDGRLEYVLVITVIMSVLVLAQAAFGFAGYAYRQTQYSFGVFDKARLVFAQVDWNAPAADVDRQLASLPEEFDGVYVFPEKEQAGTAGWKPSSEPSYAYHPRSEGNLETYRSRELFIFPLSGKSVVIRLSRNFHRRSLERILLDLSTLIAMGIFFGLELSLLVTRFIQRNLVRREEALAPGSFAYIRQIAFFFFFAFRMASSFLPVLAASLSGAAVGRVASSVPQSVEALLTCAAIFITSEIILRRGWKPPFLAGLFVAAGGTLLSSLAGNLAVFILARGITGLGYGFCWMTLRNLCLLGQDEEEQNHGFALLNAGIYAGKNCGSVLGSILADNIGDRTVLLLSACGLAICAFALMSFPNEKFGRPAPTSGAFPRPTREEYGGLLRFLLFLIVPACIVTAYTEYFLPVYAAAVGRGATDAGRGLLIYGVIIVYAAPGMSRFVRRRLGSGLGINLCYNGLLALALILTGLDGSFSTILGAIAIIALADGFGFGAQNTGFLALPAMSRLPASRSLSWLSFFKKMAAMPGPIIFALAMNFPNRIGILSMGLLFLLMVFLAGFKGKKAA